VSVVVKKAGRLGSLKAGRLEGWEAFNRSLAKIANPGKSGFCLRIKPIDFADYLIRQAPLNSLH